MLRNSYINPSYQVKQPEIKTAVYFLQLQFFFPAPFTLTNFDLADHRKIPEIIIKG